MLDSVECPVCFHTKQFQINSRCPIIGVLLRFLLFLGQQRFENAAFETLLCMYSVTEEGQVPNWISYLKPWWIRMTLETTGTLRPPRIFKIFAPTIFIVRVIHDSHAARRCTMFTYNEIVSSLKRHAQLKQKSIKAPSCTNLGKVSGYQNKTKIERTNVHAATTWTLFEVFEKFQRYTTFLFVANYLWPKFDNHTFMQNQEEGPQWRKGPMLTFLTVILDAYRPAERM